MKTVIKSMPEPAHLTEFKTVSPDGTWDQMRNDPLAHGQEACQDIYCQTIQDQKGLCAYCECRISVEDRLHRQIEHFHPKSDRSQGKNWDLDWQNMLAVCDGGTRSGDVHPLPQNMSCDACKGSANCDGIILNPLSIPPFPSLFSIKKQTGGLEAEENACSLISVLDNRCATTKELVENTIETLNLNCSRLVDLRLEVVKAIEQQKAQRREKGIAAPEALRELAEQYFSQDWPEFFTTIRCCLGQAAEDYLHSAGYQG